MKSQSLAQHFKRVTTEAQAIPATHTSTDQPSTIGSTSPNDPPIVTSSKTVIATAAVHTSSSVVVSTAGQPSGTMTNFLIRDKITQAEIMWALNGVMSHSSLRGNSNATDLFPLMFPDSDIAARFKMQKDKNSYVVTYGLCPYFQDQLVSDVKKCAFFAVSFDESLNKVAQKGQTDVVIRFWNDSINEVSTRYLTSTFLGHARSSDLLGAFISALSAQNFNLKKLLQVSMDGPNVNLKFLSELKEFLKNDEDLQDPELIEIGTCSLHVVHGAYKTAHDKCGWNLHGFLRALYYLFKDFPSRRSDYITATKSSVFPLRFCAIRWVENSAVIQRAVEMLPLLKVYVDAVAKKPPASNSFTKVKTALADKMLAAKLGFMQSVAMQLEPYLTKFQTNKPLLPFMYPDVYNLLRNLMLRFVKSNIVAGITNASKLVAVDFTKKDNVKTLQSIDVGFAASSVCKNVSGLDILKFREQCVTFLQHLCTKLIAKCPLKYRLIKGATCLDPEVMLNDGVRQARLCIALEILVEKKWMSANDADVVKREYLELCEKKSVKGKLRDFCRDRDRLDAVLHNILEQEKAHVTLKLFVQLMLTLFHGNAAVERSFSINKECLVENLLEDSLVAQRVVYDAVSVAGGISSVDVTKSMIHSVRNASAKRVEAAKKKAQDEDEAANKRKRTCQQIKALEVKKARIEESAKEEAASLNEELKKLRYTLKT